MGQIIARRLAKQGAKVAIFDVNQQGLEATAAEADNITPFQCDISNREEVGARVAQVANELGTIELLVHAAALMPSHLLIDHTHEGMEQLFRINYFGTTLFDGGSHPCWSMGRAECDTRGPRSDHQ